MRRKPRRAWVELAMSGGLLAAVMLILRPGIALAGLSAGLLLAARLVAASWRRIRLRARTGSARETRRRGRAGPLQRGVAIATTAAIAAVVLAVLSYAGAITARSNSSFGIRSVEWLRGNGAAWLVSDIERLYYSVNAPAKGGPTLTRLPTVGVGNEPTGQLQPQVARTPGPKAIAPVIQPALPGEGSWHATQSRYASRPSPPVLVTTYRPDPSYPRVLAGVARIDPRRTTVALYPGIQEPPGASGSGLPSEVPAAQRGNLLATFNSGFKPSDAYGGFFAGGHLLEPMRAGLATLVGTTSGKLDVVTWTGGERPGADVAFARQNLPLIVNHGQPNPNLSDGPEWGTTVGNSTMVWRSGVGVDRHGNLLYAAADYRTVRGLADILIHAGAVRAMELDINSYWVTLNTYGNSGGGDPKKLLAGMDRPAERYLTPDDRDFFAVFAR
jgi:Phosphodiester glycosidase